MASEVPLSLHQCWDIDLIEHILSSKSYFQQWTEAIRRDSPMPAGTCGSGRRILAT